MQWNGSNSDTKYFKGKLFSIPNQESEWKSVRAHHITNIHLYTIGMDHVNEKQLKVFLKSVNNNTESYVHPIE